MMADVDDDDAAKAKEGGGDAKVSSSNNVMMAARAVDAAADENFGGERIRLEDGVSGSGSNRGRLRPPPKPFLSIKSISSSAMKTPGSVSNFGKASNAPNFGSGGTLANGGGGGGGGIGSFHQAVLSAMKLNRSTSFHHGNAYKVAEQEQQRLQQEQELQQQQPPKPKAKMKERTKVALKLYIIQQKVAAVQEMVRHLFDLTEICREAEDNLDEDEDEVLGGLAFRRHSGIPPDPLINPKRERMEYCQANFLQKVMELETEVRMLKKLVLFLCKHRIIEKHYGVLTTIHDKMRTTHDISVRFFGIDWQHMFRISYNLGELVTEMVELARERDEHFQIDMVIPSNILRSLATLEADVSSHAEAVLRGRLSRRHQEKICLEQSRFQVSLRLQKEAQAELNRRKSKKLKKKKPLQQSSASPSAAAAAASASAAAIDVNGAGGGRTAGEAGGGTGGDSDDVAEAVHNGEAGDIMDDKDPKRGLWKSVKDLRRMLRLHRSGAARGRPPNNDDLWRTWYLGLQQMTMSVSIIATPTQHTPNRSMDVEDADEDGEAAAANHDSAGSSSVVVAAAVVESAPRLAVAEESLTSSAASSLSLEKEVAATVTSTPSAAAAAAATGLVGLGTVGTSSTPRPLTFSNCDDIIQTVAEELELEIEETKL